MLHASLCSRYGRPQPGRKTRVGVYHSGKTGSVYQLELGVKFIRCALVLQSQVRVKRIGPNLQPDAVDRTELVVQLEWWPEASTGYPYFKRPDPDAPVCWQESQVFWPLLQRVEPPLLCRELATIGRRDLQKYELRLADKRRIQQSLIPKYAL